MAIAINNQLIYILISQIHQPQNWNSHFLRTSGDMAIWPLADNVLKEFLSSVRKHVNMHLYVVCLVKFRMYVVKSVHTLRVCRVCCGCELTTAITFISIFLFTNVDDSGLTHTISYWMMRGYVSICSIQRSTSVKLSHNSLHCCVLPINASFSL